MLADFLREAHFARAKVVVYLTSGTKLVGYVDAADKKHMKLSNSARTMLVTLSAVASFMFDEEEA